MQNADLTEKKQNINHKNLLSQCFLKQVLMYVIMDKTKWMYFLMMMTY